MSAGSEIASKPNSKCRVIQDHAYPAYEANSNEAIESKDY